MSLRPPLDGVSKGGAKPGVADSCQVIRSLKRSGVLSTSVLVNSIFPRVRKIVRYFWKYKLRLRREVNERTKRSLACSSAGGLSADVRTKAY